MPSPDVADGEVWGEGGVYSYLYKRGLKRGLERAVVTIRLDRIGAFKREDTILLFEAALSGYVEKMKTGTGIRLDL